MKNNKFKKILLLRISVLCIATWIMSIYSVFPTYVGAINPKEEKRIVEEIVPPHTFADGIEEKEMETPIFLFTQSRVSGLVKETVSLSFYANKEMKEATIQLPKEAILCEESIVAGVSVEETEKENEWLIRSEIPRETFLLPLVFKEAGIYEAYLDKEKIEIEIESLEEIVEIEESKYTMDYNEFNTIVTPENFLEYFGLSGVAQFSGDTITLTPNRPSQTGSFYLKNKIDSSYPFKLKGNVFLGASNNSADGIGFGFHTGNVNEIGVGGAGFGMAGLKDVFGFKLDTYYNFNEDSNHSVPIRADPISTGAFVYMNNGWFTSYVGGDAPARSITRPANFFREISISLSENSILRIEYENMTWVRELPENLSTQDLSFIVSASTGSVFANQIFKFESFEYSRNYTEVIVNYVDDNGVDILDPESLTGLVGDLYQTESKKIQGYTLNETPGNASGRFTEEEQKVIYKYTKDHLDTISPIDPLYPEREISPENPPELPIDQGALSIDFVSQFNFGSQHISVQEKNYYAQPQQLLNEDGIVNEQEKRPNYVQISDRRFETDRNGWQLSVTQNNQFSSENGKELSGARMRLTNQQLATAHGGTAPSLQQTEPLELVPGAKRVLLMAQGNEGTGTWIYRFGDANTAGNSVVLDVPKGATPEATSYSSTFTWELSAVPGN